MVSAVIPLQLQKRGSYIIFQFDENHLALKNLVSTICALHGKDAPFVFDSTDGLGKVAQTAWGTIVKDPKKALDSLE
jgi:hypothetical protein